MDSDGVTIAYVVYQSIEILIYLFWYAVVSVLIFWFYSKRFGVLAFVSILIEIFYVVQIYVFMLFPHGADEEGKNIMGPLLYTFSVCAIGVVTISSYFGISDKKSHETQETVTKRSYFFQNIIFPTILYVILFLCCFFSTIIDEILTTMFGWASGDFGMVVWTLIKGYVENLTFSICLVIIAVVFGKEIVVHVKPSGPEHEKRKFDTEKLLQKNNSIIAYFVSFTNRGTGNKESGNTSTGIPKLSYLVLILLFLLFCACTLQIISLCILLVQMFVFHSLRYPAIDWVRCTLRYLTNFFMIVPLVFLFLNLLNVYNKRRRKRRKLRKAGILGGGGKPIRFGTVDRGGVSGENGGDDEDDDDSDEISISFRVEKDNFTIDKFMKNDDFQPSIEDFSTSKSM